ncbi:hypothetical protein H4S14_002483 [Agrobacterium vitis]|nr:hypothetical protein [Agrobacterium vitis]MBE1438727.1 hypothetical protein [Agrobacterium vitis]
MSVEDVSTLVNQAAVILAALGLPKEQQNERSSICLLSILNLQPGSNWADATAPLMGITPIMEWAREHCGKEWAPNTRETIRRRTMHQFVDASLVLYNPDEPTRPVNSPRAVYQIEPSALALLKSFGSAKWDANLKDYLKLKDTLAARYAAEREQNKIPVKLIGGRTLSLSPGDHSQLIKDIIEDFGARFVPDGQLIYAGDTGEKVGYFDVEALRALGVTVDKHGKLPDVVIYYPVKDWLLLIESVTSHGPVDSKRHGELAKLFSSAKPGLVYVTAFPTRRLMARHLSEIAWETEVWVAEAPTHLIHFNGVRFLGPYEQEG